MASLKSTVDINELMKKQPPMVQIRLTGTAKFRLRLWIAAGIFKIGAFVAGPFVSFTMADIEKS